MEKPASPSPELQIVSADKYTVADSSMGYFEDIAGTSTSYSIPAGTLKPGTTGVYVQVSAENPRGLTGADLEPYCWFTISWAGGAKFDTLRSSGLPVPRSAASDLTFARVLFVVKIPGIPQIPTRSIL